MVPPSIFCLYSFNYDVLWWIKPLDLPQLFAICHNCHCHGFSLQVATYCFIMLPPSIFCFSWLKYDVLWWIEPLDPPQLFAICHNCHCLGLKADFDIFVEVSLLLLYYASALNFLLYLTQIWCPLMDRTPRPTSIVCHLPQLSLPWIQSSLWDTWRVLPCGKWQTIEVGLRVRSITGHHIWVN